MEKRSTIARKSLRPQVNTITLDFDAGKINLLGDGGGISNGLKGKQLRGSSSSIAASSAQASSGANQNNVAGNISRTGSRSVLITPDIPSDNSIARFAAASAAFEDGSTSSSSALTVNRLGPEARIRAAEEISKIRQRAYVSEEERARLVETALSMDAPKIARQVIKDSAEPAHISSSKSSARKKPSVSSSSASFLTYDGAGGGAGGSKAHVLDEDKEFLKVVEEIERTRQRMFARANGATSAAAGASTSNQQPILLKPKFVLNDPRVSQDIMNSIAGLIDDINLADEDSKGRVSTATAEKQFLLKQAQDNINSVKDLYPVRASDDFDTKKTILISPVYERENELQSPKRDISDEVFVGPNPATSPRSPRISAKCKLSNSNPSTPRNILIDKENRELNSSARRNRNHHLKVLLLSSLRDWLALECQVPLGPVYTEVERVSQSTSTSDAHQYTQLQGPPPQSLESPGYRYLLGIESETSSPITGGRHFFRDESRFRLESNSISHAMPDINPPSCSPQSGKSGKSKDVSKSAASLHALLSERVSTADINESADPSSVSKEVLFRSNLLQPHGTDGGVNKLRVSAKQAETPLYYLSHALRMLEATLVSIGDYQSHHLPAIQPSSNAVNLSSSYFQSNTRQQSNISLSDHVGDSQFRDHFRKSLWASALAGSAAGNFVADIISERNTTSSLF